jgi:T5SS/PEP-CTERM-associated repeat protein
MSHHSLPLGTMSAHVQRSSSSSLRSIALIAVAAAVAAAIGKPAAADVSFSGDTTIGVSQVLIGNMGFGTFRIDGGSTYTTSSGQVSIGVQPTGVGFATVTGPGSQWSVGNVSMTVGGSGIGQLNILDGGVVNFTQSSGMDIGVAPSSQGTVAVDGPGSLLNVGKLTIGPLQGIGGSALLQISNDAIVNVATNQTTVTNGGRVELSGALLRTSLLSNNGVIAGSGELLVTSTSGFTSTGRIEAGAGDLLRITGAGEGVQNRGIVAADGGEIHVQRPLINTFTGESAGEISLRNGIIRVGTNVSSGPQLTNSAVLAATGGLNDFYGRITNSTGGHIAVTNNSVIVFHDNVEADGGTITVFPGSSAVFLEDLTMTGSSVLLADLAGSGADTGFGEIEVVGNATLNSSLNVTLASGFTPEEGDTFPILAASSITGALSLGDVADLPSGLKWSLEHETNRVLLSVVPGLAGDYNGDGSVDAGDYIVWRKLFGQQGSGLPADGNSNGEVDGGDYDFWRQRLGDTLSSGGGSVAGDAAVPEPCCAMLILAGLALASCNRWKLN